MKHSDVDLKALHLALLNITPEGRLQRETKDIIDELGMMIYLIKQQREVLRRFKRHVEGLLDPKGKFKDGPPNHPQFSTANEEKRQSTQNVPHDKWRKFRSISDEVLQESEDHLEELAGLQRSAEEVCRGVSRVSFDLKRTGN